MKSVAIKRGGQKPRAGVRRYKDGSIVRSERLPRETEDDTKATALDARLRRELGVEAWLAARGTPKALREARRAMDDALLSDKNPLGRLLLVGRRDAGAGITQTQYDAGDYFIRLYEKRARIGNWPKPNVSAIDYGAVRGLSIHPENSPEWERDIKQQFERVCQFIYDLNNGDVYELMKRVLIEGFPPESMEDLGALRVGLNAVNRARGV